MAERFEKLQKVNKAAKQAREDLGILAAMATDHGVPTWFAERIKEIEAAIITVETDKDDRSTICAYKQVPCIFWDHGCQADICEV